MLGRFLLLLLILANVLFGAWTQGWLRELGVGPQQSTEPQRLQQQIKPEALRILTAQEARRLEALAPKPTPAECLQSDLLDARQSAALRPLLGERLPSGSWTIQATTLPARWIIYMGKFASPDLLGKKKLELKARGVAFASPHNPALEPGLTLGDFDTQAKASAALKDLAKSGVHTAKVMQERPELRGDVLRLPQVDDKLRPLLEPLKPVLGNKGLQSCS